MVDVKTKVTFFLNLSKTHPTVALLFLQAATIGF